MDRRTAVAATLAGLVLLGCAGTVPGGTRSPSTPPIVPPTAATDPPGQGGAPDGLDRQAWVGVWRGEQPDLVGRSQIETVLMANGTFTSQSTNEQAGTYLTVWGEWDILTFTDRPTLRFTIEGHQPDEWCGPLGCQTVMVPTGISNHFEFVDRDTVVLWDPLCEGADCRVVYQRGQ